MSNSRFDAHKVAEILQGTCKSLQEGLEEAGYREDEIDTVDFFELDELVFCCDQCGWWCEIAEMVETDDPTDQICDECHDA